jgi:hypothetical protein
MVALVGWVATKHFQAKEEKVLLEMLGKVGVYVYYPYEWANGKPPEPEWLRRLFGNAFFRTGQPVLVAQGHGDSFYVATSLSALKDLVIETQQIEDADFTYLLRALKRLETIRLEGQAKITAKSLCSLPELPLLRSFTWNECKTNEGMCECIARVHQLKELHFWDSTLTDADLKRIACMSQLESLSISSTQLPATATSSIGNMVHLKHLDLSFTPVGDAEICKLNRMRQLKDVDLRSTKVMDGGLLSLSDLPNLHVIDVRATAVTADGVADLRHRAPAIQVLWSPVRGATRSE